LSPQDVAENAAPLLARIHPANIGSFFASAEESAKTMLPWHLEFRIDHPTKKEVWVEWQATPVREGGSLFWHGIMLDITERKTMQRRMELLERAVNQSSDAVFLEFGGRRFSLTIARDISERKRMLEELQRSERDFRSLAENVPDNIPRWDAEGRYLYINPTHEHALGVGGDQVRGKRISEVFPGGHFADRRLNANDRNGRISADRFEINE
jgi:PAS domain-containing protein